MEGGVDFGDLFAYAGEDGFFGGGAGDFLDAGELTAGDDVEAGAVGGEEFEDCE